MKQPTPSRNSIRDLSILAVFAAMMIALQVGLSFLPNVELVTLLIILATCYMGAKSLLSVAVFVLVEGLIYGFHIWWINYLYIWPLLVILVLLFRKFGNTILWAILAGIYGLLFGTFCSIPYFLTGGIGAGFGYIVAGIPFDLVHCVSNFVLTLLLFKPLSLCMEKILPSQTN